MSSSEAEVAVSSTVSEGEGGKLSSTKMEAEAEVYPPPLPSWESCMSSMACGYELVTEPADNLKCQLCSKLAEKPVQHEACGAIFCEECVKGFEGTTCPNQNCLHQFYGQKDFCWCIDKRGES